MAATSEAITAGEHALELTRRSTVIDALSLSFLLEERFARRWLDAGVNATIVTIALEEDFDTVMRAVESALRRVDDSSHMQLVRSAGDVLSAKAAGRLGIILGTQGCSVAEPGKLWRIDLMARLGVRSLGLAYTSANLLCDGCGERRNAGLTYLGREVIERVNDLPMLLDLSHCGHRTRAEAAQAARAPVVTHSNAYSVCANDRNTQDDTARVIADKGGILGVTALPRAVRAEGQSVEHMVDHVAHFTALAGAASVGFGFDSVEGWAEGDSKHVPNEVVRWRTFRPDIFGPVEAFGVEPFPAGLRSVRTLANLTEALLMRQYSDADVEGLLGANWLRAMERFWA